MAATDFEQASRAANWHQSSVENILGCARNYYLTYELALPQPVKLNTVGGTAHHVGVEVHERARMAGQADGVPREEMEAAALAELESLMAAATDDSLAEYVIKRAGKTKRATALAEMPLADAAEAGREELRGEVRAATANWWDAPVNADGDSLRDVLLRLRPLAIEVYGKASVVAGADPLAGTIDGVYLDEETGEVLIVDQKSSFNMSGWGEKDDDHRDQPAFYATVLVYAAEELGLPAFTKIPRTLFAVSRRALPKRASATWVGAALREVRLDELDMRRLGERVREAQARKDVGIFEPDPTWFWCRSCPFRDRCVVGDGTLAVAVERIEVAA